MTEQPGYGYPPPPYFAPVSPSAVMPATVRAATIVTYVCSAVTVAMTLLMVLFIAFVGRFVFGAFERPDRAAMVLFVLVGVLFALGCSAIASWFAWQTGRRKGWARIGLAVCSGLTVLLSLLAFSPPSIVGLLGGSAVLILLFVPETNAWFRDVE